MLPSFIHDEIQTQLLTSYYYLLVKYLPELKLAARIANLFDRNLRRAILMLEACKVDQYPFMDDQKVAEPGWQTYIRNIATLMVNQQSPKILLEIRNRYYELLTHAIPTELIFRGLLQEVTKKCDLQLKIQIAHLVAEYEHRMHQGSKTIFHLEAFTARFMAIYKKFMDASLEGFD